MKHSTAIKMLLTQAEKKQLDLVEVLGMSSRQSLNNKFREERWSATDLVKIAEYTGCKLAFILPDGQQLVLDSTEE